MTDAGKSDAARGTSLASSCVLVPRWGGKASSDWYPWFEEQIPEVCIMPAVPKDAPPEAWQQAVTNALPTDPEQFSETVVVTHSLGMHGLVMALNAAPSGPSLRGALLVAAWWDVDRAFWDRIEEPWSAIEPYLDYSFDQRAVQRRLGRAVALISDDDPIVSSPVDRTKHLLESRLGCEVRICPGRKHFNQPQEPDVVTVLRELRRAVTN